MDTWECGSGGACGAGVRMEVITDARSDGVICSLKVLAGIVGSSLAKSGGSNCEPKRVMVKVIGVSA